MVDPLMAPLQTVDLRIAPVTPLDAAGATPATSPVEKKEVFADVFRETVAKVENYRLEAEASIDRFLKGQDEELHHVATAAQQAEVAFELFLQTKNKVVQAYQEIMRMQL
ncbi:MAG: flagellar hook-basal body complex protein FliE [Bryobacteraceae bacterium]